MLNFLKFFPKIELRCVSFICKHVCLLVTFMMIRIAVIHCLCVPVTVPGNISLIPAKKPGRRVSSHCTDEAVEVQGGPMAPRCCNQGWDTGLSDLRALVLY